VLKLVLKRLAGALPNLVGVVIVTFLLTRALPGDPAADHVALSQPSRTTSDDVPAEFKADAKKILGAIGNVHEVPEKQLDAVTGLSGTVWDGAIQRLSLGGVALGPVRWQIKPSRLFLGQLAADVSATLPDGFLNTTAALSLGGGLAASNLEGAAPLAWLAPALGGGSSQLTARFDQFVIKKGHVENRDPMQPTATGGAGMLVSTIRRHRIPPGSSGSLMYWLLWSAFRITKIRYSPSSDFSSLPSSM
jgi:hypothetical protein